MYEGDSFFTLSPMGRAGLVLLSILLSGALIWMTAGLARAKPLPVRLAIAALAFYGFVWLSPQIYYVYYIMIFDTLPWQTVIKAPPGGGDLVKIMLFQGGATLSAHGIAEPECLFLR